MAKSLLLSLFFVLGAWGHAQENGTIQGKVLDGEMGLEPLLMAKVTIVETSESTLSDFHGNFEFPKQRLGEYTLAISYLGYDNLILPVTIKEDQQEEVVATLHAKILPKELYVGINTLLKSMTNNLPPTAKR